MDFITGENREQAIMFPERMDEYVDENACVRVIDAYVNGLDICVLGFNRFEPKETGRPPYAPKDILKLYLYGYMHRIRSSRRLEAESKRNLEVIWLLCKLSPDHKTIADFRKQNSKALKNVFKDFVKLCVKLDLYGKELAGIDGSKFKAVNSKERNFTKDKLKDRMERIDKKIDEYLTELDENDTGENSAEKEKSAGEIKEIIKKLNERKKRYQGYADELEQTGETQKSLTDPESRLMLSNGKMDVCYNVQTAVDAKNKLIVEYEVTSNANDMNQLTPMIGKIQDILETKEIAVTADKGYASVSDIASAVQLGADLHVAGTDSYICVPVKKEEQTGITPHDNGRCVYVKERNISICPTGQTLYPASYKKSRGEAVFMNSQACKICKHRCTSETRAFRYQFVMAESDFKTDYDDKKLYVKQIHIKPDKSIYAQRKSICEHPFGTVKQSMDGRYCLTKGKRKITGEFALIYLAYNLKRVINILGTRKLIKAMI